MNVEKGKIIIYSDNFPNGIVLSGSGSLIIKNSDIVEINTAENENLNIAEIKSEKIRPTPESDGWEDWKKKLPSPIPAPKPIFIPTIFPTTTPNVKPWGTPWNPWNPNNIWLDCVGCGARLQSVNSPCPNTFCPTHHTIRWTITSSGTATNATWISHQLKCNCGANATCQCN